MIGFIGRKGLRLPKVINQFERKRVQPGKARWRSKTPPSVAVKHSNGARPIGPLDGSGSRSKERKPADGRRQARLRISPGLPSPFIADERIDTQRLTVRKLLKPSACTKMRTILAPIPSGPSASLSGVLVRSASIITHWNRNPSLNPALDSQ